MKTKLFPLCIVAAGFIGLGAQAQVATPSTPAPVIETAAMPQASQMVYSPRLPSATELTNVAAAQGLTIDRIVQTASQMTVVYRSANGQTNTVAYVLLPAAGAPAPSATVASTTTVVPQVVYAAPAPAPVYYYEPYYYPTYYAGPWYAPVSLSVGWGVGFHGGWRGGFHSGHRWR